MMLYENRLIVQAINMDSAEFVEDLMQGWKPPAPYLNYRGLGRYISWPLIGEQDAISRSLQDESRERWFSVQFNINPQRYALEVAPDRNYCIRYLNHCRSKGIAVRILFCRAERNTQIWDAPLPQTKFLGYDYSTSQSFIEVIPDDLLYNSDARQKENPEMRALIECRNKLNENQLFNTLSDIEEYVQRREKAISAGIVLEPSDDLNIIEVSEVIGEL